MGCDVICTRWYTGMFAVLDAIKRAHRMHFAPPTCIHLSGRCLAVSGALMLAAHIECVKGHRLRLVLEVSISFSSPVPVTRHCVMVALLVSFLLLLFVLPKRNSRCRTNSRARRPIGVGDRCMKWGENTVGTPTKNIIFVGRFPPSLWPFSVIVNANLDSQPFLNTHTHYAFWSINPFPGAAISAVPILS